MYKIKVMIGKLKNLFQKYTKEIDIITQFLFVALVFYLLYIGLWTFCPCP